MKLPIVMTALLTLPLASAGMDVAPYQPGQTVDAEQARELQQRFAKRPNHSWREPANPDSIDKHPDAELIRYGIAVLQHTASTIGPDAADPGKRLSGNNLNCSSCHLKGNSGLPGTKKFGIPLVNVMNDYPQFRARSMTIGTIEERVNGCMTRSMGDGTPLPPDSREMQGMAAYFKWLAEGTSENDAMEGTGLPKIDLPARRADAEKGQAVFQQFCQSCHGADGTGLQAPNGNAPDPYLFPPIAGDDSFNDGAGMSRLKTATRFIYGNMPLGTEAGNPVLTVDQAYDVAGYMMSLPRPTRAGRDKDFPDPAFRPADYPVPAYFGDDKAALDKAKYGSYTN